MRSEPEYHLLSFFHRFPGAVIRLSPEGIVVGTNGRLERELGLGMTGRSSSELLDPESSGYVADNGPGIAPDLQKKIWTLFQTLEPEETAGGTGIGLAIVKKLVEAEGGEVWVTSREGDGATFHFLWPRIHGQPVENETS